MRSFLPYTLTKYELTLSCRLAWSYNGCLLPLFELLYVVYVNLRFFSLKSSCNQCYMCNPLNRKGRGNWRWKQDTGLSCIQNLRINLSYKFKKLYQKIFIWLAKKLLNKQNLLNKKETLKKYGQRNAKSARQISSICQ